METQVVSPQKINNGARTRTPKPSVLSLKFMFRSYWFYQIHNVFKDSWLKKNVRILDLENTYISHRIIVANYFKHSFPNF